MNNFAIVSTWAVLMFGGVPLLGDEACSKDAACCAGGKVSVSKLLESWKRAGEEATKLSSSEREKIVARFKSLASGCPIGSRMGPTLKLAHESLASFIAFEEAHAKSCPFSTAQGTEAAQSEAFKQGAELAASHSKLLRELHQLSAYAVAALPAACDAEGSVLTSAQKTGAPECGALKAKLDAVKASWQKAPAEMACLSEAKKAAGRAEMISLSSAFKPAGLLPPTFLALADGFDALDKSNQRLDEWSKANPDFMKSVSEEAKRAFEGQNALVREVREVLAQARKAAAPCCDRCQGKAATKGDTAPKA